MNVVFEIVGQRGKLQVVEDVELGYIFAVIPYDKKVSPSVVRELREQTLDPWRFVEGVGFVLDLTAWREQSEVSIEDIKNKIEGKYREVVDNILEIVENAKASESAKKRKKKRKKKKGGRRSRRKR